MALKKHKMNTPRLSYTASRQYVWEDAEGPISGVASLTRLSAEKPFYTGINENRRAIIYDGCLWLQIAPRDEHWWLTAVYSPDLLLNQFYFDVTLENHILPGGMSWCNDLFLDMVVDPHLGTYFLDRDELDQALADGMISMDQYRLALTTGDEINKKYGDCAKLENLCRPYFDALYSRF